jgi:hypothetical protein
MNNVKTFLSSVEAKNVQGITHIGDLGSLPLYMLNVSVMRLFFVMSMRKMLIIYIFLSGVFISFCISRLLLV